MPRASIAWALSSNFARFILTTLSAATLFGACTTSNTGTATGIDTNTSIATEAMPTEPVAIATHATKIVASEPWLASLLAPSATGWTEDVPQLEGDDNNAARPYVSLGWRTFGPSHTDKLGARWPAFSDAPFVVGLGQDPTRRLTFTPVGARRVRATLHEGRIIHHEAYRATDVVVGTSVDRFEELLILRDAGAPSTFVWTLARGSRIVSSRLAPSGALELADVRGTVLLRISRPFAIDAIGTRRGADLALDGNELRIALDTKGLRFPIALDPSVETPIWTDVSAASTPPTARRSFGMGYHGSTVVFGGFIGAAKTNETWQFNGSTWSGTACGAACASSPTARIDVAMALNTSSNKIVLFGGYGTSANCDTWELTGTTWSNTIVKAPPCTAAAPAARARAAMSSAASGVIMFGGEDSSNLQDTWAFNAGTWTQLCTTAPCTDVGKRPSPRNAHKMVYDASRNRVVLFGGDSNGTIMGDTWEWDGAAWSEKCTTAPCNATLPTPRKEHMMAYDTNRKKVVLTGGWNGAALPFFGGTWEWDGAKWTALTLENAPSPNQRIDSGMTFDTSNKRTVLFGGTPTPGTSDDNKTWTFYTRGDPACASASDCDVNFCVDSTCCEGNCGPCEICNGAQPGVCTAVTNVETARCGTTQFCNPASTCVAKLAAGGACTVDAGCAAGLVCSPEGVCCNSMCNADGCHSCLTANTGGATGSCLPITAGTTARAVGGGCATTAASTCGLDGKCNGSGACRSYPAGTICVGQSCAATTQTNASTCNGTGTCVAGTTQACAAGYKCVGTACPTTCSGTDDTPCASDHYCDGAMCVPKNADGTIACTRDAFCTNGHCNHDQICCNETCNGPCESCTTSRKGSGANGICGPTATDTDPYTLCLPGSTSCGAPGKCDGLGRGLAACLANARSGAVCGATTCAADLQSGLQCDGNGACLQSNNVSCAPYKCSSTACATTCAADGDCQQVGTGFFCSAANKCAAKNGNGTSCSAAKECASANCVDGVCCDSACGAQCGACNVPGKVGTCSATTGAPVGARTPCNAVGTVCGGECNGTNSAACTYPDATKSCGSTCTGNTETLSTCDTQGGCKTSAPHPCGVNLVCDPTTTKCKTACASDADCTPVGAFICDLNKHQCAPVVGATCNSDATGVISPGTGTTDSCAPYKCSGAACLKVCASVNECVAPNVCDPSGACVPPTSGGGGGDDSGCATTPGGSSQRSDVAWLTMLGVGLAFGAMRKRRRRRRGVSNGRLTS